ncbi:hypothetical protein IX324_003010 [Bacteroides pyogenes]|nr:hypothetical protein [Bacteroides pyogenes]
MNTHLSADLTEYLAQQGKQSHYHLPSLLVSVLALLPISQVRFLNVIVFRSLPVLAKSGTDTTHHLICSLDTFPKQLHIGRETHQAFIAARICVDCIKILHVWLPSICKYLLLLLYLQLLGQFQQYAVN